ncbi:MAG: hypothetical protein ACRDRG_09135 [Pseudonocardiaceae bacterium]
MSEPRARRTEQLFKVALLIKGVDGSAELLGAMALLLVSGATVHRLVADVLSRDLLGPPDGALPGISPRAPQSSRPGTAHSRWSTLACTGW